MNAHVDPDEFLARPAKREAAPVTAAFIGQSGSGKTYSALLFARGLVGPAGKIGVIDTEGKRALIYADDEQIGGFEHIDFRAPWSSERYRDAVRAAVNQGWQAIVIDSASHEHEAEGGMLDYADAEERRLKDKRGFERAKWIRPKVAHNRFIQTAKSVPAHVIFCIREKRIANLDAKQGQPKELFEPVCEKNLFFEMMLAVRLEPGTHAATFQKVPEPFLRHIRQGEVITVAHGALLMQEAGKGRAEDPLVAKQRDALEELARDSGTSAVATAWEALPIAICRALKPELPRLRKLAAETDARIAAEEEARRPSDRDRASANLLDDAAEEIPFDE